MQSTNNDGAFERGSGNVFADIGLSNAAEHLAKADMVLKIKAIVEDRGWGQAEAAERMGVKQPDVSSLFRGKFSGFSQERLQLILQRLGISIEIVLSPNSEGIGTLRVREHT